MPKKNLILSTFFLFIPLFFPFFSFEESFEEVYDLRSFTHPTHTRVVVDIGKLREYASAELKEPDRVYVDIYQARLNPILHGKAYIVKTDYISQIRIAQKNPTTVRVTVDLDFKRIRNYRIFHLFDPFRIVIDIYPEETPGPSPKIPQPAQPAQSGYSLVRQLGLGIQTIVIDPGHGGQDPGCIGKDRLKEKDIVLEVALELKRLLGAKKELEVIMTRESDIFIPLENRTVIANQKKADIFISIHANSHPNKKRAGAETFFLNFSPDPQVNEIAARENATSSKNISEMRDIIKKIVQNSKIVESKELAEKIQQNLVKSFSQKYNDIKNLGVKGGPFWVLIGGDMPSVLVEISHLSNPTEGERLSSPSYRKEAARGIYEGILAYIQSLGKG